jgi:hypothetical protein
MICASGSPRRRPSLGNLPSIDVLQQERVEPAQHVEGLWPRHRSVLDCRRAWDSLLIANNCGVSRFGNTQKV